MRLYTRVIYQDGQCTVMCLNNGKGQKGKVCMNNYGVQMAWDILYVIEVNNKYVQLAV